jgi:uncharacterized membrane protein YgcG
VTVHLPKDLQQSRDPICYTGANGSQLQLCTIEQKGGDITATTTDQLASGQTLTYVAGFQKGYFTPFSWRNNLADNAKIILEISVPILILGGGTFAYWLARGRDPRGRGTIIPQYDAPDKLKPAEVGTIIDFKLDNRDITATIIDLAIRHYLKIIETKDKRVMLKDRTTYSLQLLTTDFSKLDANEQLLVKALFPNPTVGQAVDVSALKATLASTATEYAKNVETQLTTAGYFRGNPLTAGKTITSALVSLGFILYFVHGFGWPIFVGLSVGGGLAFVFAYFMTARTAKGVEAKEHILGLKMYLNIAEKDRIAALQSPDAKYAAPNAEPVKTVELFEKLLPYAMVLGVEKQWAGKFADIYKTPPDWYNGNWSTFNTIYLVSALNDGVGSATNAAFSAPSNSGSSGFGGGGFSGGGGGGGGGGGW